MTESREIQRTQPGVSDANNNTWSDIASEIWQQNKTSLGRIANGQGSAGDYMLLGFEGLVGGSSLMIASPVIAIASEAAGVVALLGGASVAISGIGLDIYGIAKSRYQHGVEHKFFQNSKD